MDQYEQRIYNKGFHDAEKRMAGEVSRLTKERDALLRVKAAAEQSKVYLGIATCDGCLYEGGVRPDVLCVACNVPDAIKIRKELDAALSALVESKGENHGK